MRLAVFEHAARDKSRNVGDFGKLEEPFREALRKRRVAALHDGWHPLPREHRAVFDGRPPAHRVRKRARGLLGRGHRANVVHEQPRPVDKLACKPRVRLFHRIG